MKVVRVAVAVAILLAVIEYFAVTWIWGWMQSRKPEAAIEAVAATASVIAFVFSWIAMRSYSHRSARAKQKETDAEEQARKQVERLESLRRIDLAINSNVELRYVFHVFLREVVSQLKVDAAAVLILDEHSGNLVYRACQGFRSDSISGQSQRLGEGLAGKAALERHLVHEPDLERADNVVQSKYLYGESFVTYFAVPLIARGQVRGVLEVLSRNPLVADGTWLSFLEGLAGQAAIAIENASMLHELQKSHTELKLAYDSTLEGWVKALDLRDKETEGHTQRVTEMTVRLAKAMGVDPADIVQIRRGALLHDVGKIGIPDEILLKPGPLTEEEWETMRKHPVYAYEWLSPVDYLRPALDIPYAHHERWDGTGYPRGLKGEEIPLAARIFAVVDVWDALRSDRPYRQGWPLEKVRDHLRENSGTHFDPKVVAAFLSDMLISEVSESIAA